MATKNLRSSRKHSQPDNLHEEIERLLQEADSVPDNNIDMQIAICLECKTLLQETNLPEGVIRNTLTLAVAYNGSSRYLEARDALKEIEVLCREQGCKESKARWHYELARASRYLTDYGTAILHAEESLQLLKGGPASSKLGAVHMLLSLLYLDLSITDQALEFAMAALEAFQLAKEASGVSMMLNNIGTVYDRMANFTQAYQYYQESLALKQEIGDTKGVANTLNNMANILFWSRKEYDEALKFYNESLAISRKHGYEESSAYSLQQMGQVCVYIEEYQQAISYARDAVALSEARDVKAELAYALLDLGFVYFQAGQQEESIQTIYRGLKIAEEIHYTLKMEQGYNLLRQIYEATEDYKNATHFSSLFINLQRERMNEASDKRAKHLAVLFDVEKTRQEKEIYRLQTEKLHQEAEHKSRELTTLAMYLMQKNEFLNKLSCQIEDAETTSLDNLTELFSSVRQQVREALNSEQGWEYFEQQFKLVHHDFISKLSELYPSLTPTELRVSAFLRMNLSTKEIANLLYQSPRSVESYRYRLRRKMNLTASDNLATFLASI